MDALQVNPGAVVAVVVWTVLTAYAGSVLIFRLRPWRPAWLASHRWRWILAAVVGANWLYVLAAGRV